MICPFLLVDNASCCVAQVVGFSNPDEVLTALRELPESVSRDQDRLVPLVAEVVRDSEPSSSLFSPHPVHLLLTCLCFVKMFLLLFLRDQDRMVSLAAGSVRDSEPSSSLPFPLLLTCLHVMNILLLLLRDQDPLVPLADLVLLLLFFALTFNL